MQRVNQWLWRVIAQEGDSEMKSVSLLMEELFWYYVLFTLMACGTALYIMQFNRELVSC